MRVLMILSCVVATCLAQQGYNYQNQPQSNLNFGPQPTGQVQVAFNAVPEQSTLQQGAQVQIKFNPASQEQPQITFNSGPVHASTPVTLNSVSPNHAEAAQRGYLPPVQQQQQQNNANLQYANTLPLNPTSFQTATSNGLNTAHLAANNVAASNQLSFNNAQSALRAYLPPVQQQPSYTAAPSSGSLTQNFPTASYAPLQVSSAPVNSHSTAQSSQLNQAAYAAAPNHQHQHPLQQQQPPLNGNHQTSHHDHTAPAPHEIVTKNFYLHTAPEDEEGEGQSQQAVAGPVRKNFNVVFIKAPADSPKASILKLAQPQNEEKTVIYVLTKKTDAADIKTQLAETAPKVNKPEVFFIKYKTPEEAEHAQQQIQAQYDSLGGTSQVSDEGVAPVQSVIGSLDTAHQAEGSSDHQANAPADSSALQQTYAPAPPQAFAPLPAFSQNENLVYTNVPNARGYLPPTH